MKDLKDARFMCLKAWLFLVIGIVTFALLILETQTIRNATLFCLMIWAFCRAYYFAFYVIEHYVVGKYRYAGLVDFLKARLIQRRRDPES